MQTLKSRNDHFNTIENNNNNNNNKSFKTTYQYFEKEDEEEDDEDEINGDGLLMLKICGWYKRFLEGGRVKGMDVRLMSGWWGEGSSLGGSKLRFNDFKVSLSCAKPSFFFFLPFQLFFKEKQSLLTQSPLQSHFIKLFSNIFLKELKSLKRKKNFFQLIFYCFQSISSFFTVLL